MTLGANRYFSAEEPWVLQSPAESDQKRFGTVLYTTLEAVRIAALLVQPVMPESGESCSTFSGRTPGPGLPCAVGTRLVPGTVLPTPRAFSPATSRRLTSQPAAMATSGEESPEVRQNSPSRTSQSSIAPHRRPDVTFRRRWCLEGITNPKEMQ